MVVGVANTLVDVAIYFVLTRYLSFFPDHVSLSRTISFLGGSLCSFTLNRIWTFERHGRWRAEELAKFYVTVSMSLLIGLASMQFFMKVFHLYDLVALALSVGFTFVWNFTISKLWVFGKAEEKNADRISHGLTLPH